jgi:hypothetical protein
VSMSVGVDKQCKVCTLNLENESRNEHKYLIDQ